jgi:hypothetical protein
MATEGHRRGRGKDLTNMSSQEMDQELKDIRGEIDRLTLKMHQKARER